MPIQKVLKGIIKRVKRVDTVHMKQFRQHFSGFLSVRRSLIITSILVIALFFQLFTPKRVALTAAGPEKPVRVEAQQERSAAVPVALEKISTSLKRGGTLQALLLNTGISSSDTLSIIEALSPYLDLTRLKAGQEFEIYFDNKKVSRIVIPASIEKEILVERLDSSSFKAEESLKELISYPMKKSLTVDSSLYGSAVNAGIPDSIIMDLIQLFSFDVDFQRDIHRGDELSAVYELVYDENGDVVDTGNIMEAELKTNRQDLKIYRFVSADGKADYYNEEGKTVRKTLLRTPLNGAYITSNYGMRINPFSGYTTMHKGVDFGAPRGTPIKASGDGTVVIAGYNEVYGNHIKLRHVNNYETLYAHQTSFARGIRRGARVEQGQVIGYVGTTGMSTGPHLHYEVRLNGRQVNPSTVKFPPGRTLDGVELQLYKNQIRSYNASF